MINAENFFCAHCAKKGKGGGGNSRNVVCEVSPLHNCSFTKLCIRELFVLAEKATVSCWCAKSE